MQDRRSPGSFSRDALGPTGTMVLGDGAATGLVFVSRSLLAQICEDAQARARTGPHEHFEIGGLLIGPKPQNGELRVDEAIPLGFEYRFGPSFPMLLAGLDSADPAIAAIQQDGSKTVVGLYRILTRSDGELRASDLEMLATLEKTPSSLPHFQCCFIVALESRSEIVLRVLVPKNGVWEEMQQVTLHLDAAPALRPAAEPLPEPAQAEPSTQPAPELPAAIFGAATARPVAAPPPATPATTAAEAPALSAPRSNITAVYTAVALILIALVGGLYWISQRYASANGVSRVESQARARTGFSANRDGAAWKLTWDSAATEALKPTGATLSIQDGAGQQDIPLTAADLSSGTIYYTPKSGDLAFRFEVRRDGATVAEERVRVVEGIKQAAVSSLANSVPQTAPALVGTPNGGSNSGGARIFIPPKENSRQVESAPILTEPAPMAASPAPQPSPPPPGFKTPPAPAPAAPTSPPAAAQPRPQPAPPTSVPTPAASPTLYNYVGPRAIKRVQPLVEFGARRNGMIQVQVLVGIDASGKVVKVTPAGPIADVRLVAAATKAAQFWEFEPARLNGRAIASEMTLIFRF